MIYTKKPIPPAIVGNTYKYNYILIINTNPKKVFCTGKVQTTISGLAINTSKKTMEVPSGRTQSIDFATGKSTIGSVKVKVNNENEETSTWLYAEMQGDKSIYKTKCELWFREENINDAGDKRNIQLYAGELKSHEPIDEYETGYTFEIVDPIESIKESVLTNNGDGYGNYYFKKCKFYGTGSIAAVIDRPTGFEKAFRLKDGKGISTSSIGFDNPIQINTGYYIVDWQPTAVGGTVLYPNRYKVNLIDQAGATDAGRIGIVPDNLTQATFSSNFWEYAYYVICFKGHPIDLAKLILGLLNISYDNTSFEAIRSKTNETLYDNFYWEWKEKLENPLDFLQAEIYSVCNCYPVITPGGSIKLKYNEQPTVLDIATGLTVSHENILSMPKKSNDYENVINNIVLKTAYDLYDEKYKRTDMYIDSFSFSKFGKLIPKQADEREIKGINTIGGLTDTDIEEVTGTIANVLFDRFKRETTTIECEVFYSDICSTTGTFLELGDFVKFYHKNLVEWEGDEAGTRGINDADDILYAVLEKDEWGEYTNIKENNNAILLQNGTFEDITVARIISSVFFDSVSGVGKAYAQNVTWLTNQGVII